MEQGAFQEWGGEFQGDDKPSQYNRDYLYDGRLDNYCDKKGRTGWGLEPSWISQRSPNEIPEKLAPNQAPKAGPESINTRSDSDKAGILVPNEVSHVCLMSRIDMDEKLESAAEMKYGERCSRGW